MRRVTRPTGNLLLDISKQNDMHFVYAFFFQNGDDVHVKVGESTKPYRRLADIVHGSPFPVSQAVFCHIGGKSLARSFEETIRAEMGDRRTRGEWYVFDKSEGKAFAAKVAEVYAKCSGRLLKWTVIDLEKFQLEQAQMSEKFAGRRSAKVC